MASHKYEKTSDEDYGDETYLCYDFATDSFIGTLQDKYSLPEADVKDYIKYGNPKLYERLHHLPFASSDIPQSFQAQRQFKKAFEVRQSLTAPTNSGKPVPDTGDLIAKFQGANVQALHTLDTMKMELRKHIRTKLIDGHILILKKHPSQSHPLNCDNPACGSYGLVRSGSFYLTLRLSYFTSDDPFVLDHNALTHYCLCCLEDIFDGQPTLSEDENDQNTHDSLDGVEREIVLKTAKRLYNCSSHLLNNDCESARKLVPMNTVVSAAHIDLDTRKQKKADIEATLAEVDKFEKRRKTSGESTETPNSELSISRPYFMEKSKDRYKKQGLSRYDRDRLRLEERKRQSTSPQVSPTSTSSFSSEDRQCYCRELCMNTEDMIQCSNEWCSVGWVHLRCAGLDETFVQSEDFFCNYCKDDCGPFGQFSDEKEPVELTDSSSTMSLESVADGGSTACEEGEIEESEQEDTDEEEGEQDITIVIRSSPWGTPINLQTLSLPSQRKNHMDSPSESEATTTCTLQNAQFERLDGTESTNIADDTDTDAPFFYEELPLYEPEQDSKLLRLTNFSDLARHIFAVDLSPNENRVFEQWKNSILEQPAQTPTTSALDTETGTEQAHNPGRLSQLLHQADAEEVNDDGSELFEGCDED